MEHLKVINRVAVLCLAGLVAACSSESVVVGNVTVSDVRSSGCKQSASPIDSRPEFYNSFIAQKPVLRLLLGADNVVRGRFSNFSDNCSIDLFHVDAREGEGRIILILSPDKDMLTDCICLYDVDFKMEHVAAGSYQLEVYHTTASRQISKGFLIYEGNIVLEKGTEVMLPLSR
ncbi:MAG: hypothetical protein K6A82_01350 [Prevotella sp.]|nr:hypothetical protein [Prevotella sp.]